VKPWQFDPTKWSIWTLSKVGMASDLRTVDREKIMLAELAEKRRQFDAKLESGKISLSESGHKLLEAAQESLQHAKENWEARLADYRKAAGKQMEASKDKLAEIHEDLYDARKNLRHAIQEWKEAVQAAQLQFA